MRSDLGGTLGLLVGAACSSTLHADDYDRSCSTSADCETVFVGDVCDCACDHVGAVSKTGAARYSRDRADITCSDQCGPCANQHVAVCVSGTCHAEKCAGSVVYCAAACGAQPVIEACTCPAGMVDTMTCAASTR